jgi:FtsZ-interacting cell division protein ZipA
MISVLNPWVIVGFVVSVMAFYSYGHHKGWAERDVEMQAEIAKADAEARLIERNMTEQINATTTKLQEANNAIDQKQSALNRAIAAGRVRLPAPSCVQASPSTTAPTVNQQAAAQPDRAADQPSDAERETLRLIAQIAADGDKAINQLNACVDAYNQVREQINGAQ